MFRSSHSSIIKENINKIMQIAAFKAILARRSNIRGSEIIFIIFAASYVNSSRENCFKCCNLHDLIYIFLDNGAMVAPKRRIL